nr:hypothetical protein [Tanacetum cinerariifolium]
MDDPNITMKEYIKLEVEKARKLGKVFNWETAKYGKILYDEDVYDLRSVETEFPAIAFNDHISSKKHFLVNPRMLFYLIVNLYVSFGIPLDPKRYYKDGDYALMLQRPTTECLKFFNLCVVLIDFVDMALLPRDQRHQYLRFGPPSFRFRVRLIKKIDTLGPWTFDGFGFDLWAEIVPEFGFLINGAS